jgi:hypothetical protein
MVFNNKYSLPSVHTHKIKDESKEWNMVGAEYLTEIMS